MRTETTYIPLCGAIVALALAFGASIAQSALIVPNSGGLRLTEPSSPVADVKAGINAGGLVGAKVDGSIGGGKDTEISVGADIGSDVRTAGAKGDADIGAGTNTGAGGSKIDAGFNAGAGGATVDAGANAAADARRGAVRADGGIGVDADGAAADAGAKAELGASKRGINADAGVSTDVRASGATIGARAGVAGDAGADSPVGLNTDISAGVSRDPVMQDTSGSGSEAAGSGINGVRPGVAVPALAQTISTILLPILSLEDRLGHDVGSKEFRDTQLAMLGCVDPHSDASCPSDNDATFKTIPHSRIHFEIMDLADGAANATTSTVVHPTRAAGLAYPQPTARASHSFGISLADPVRSRNELVVRCIIVNTSSQNQSIPPLDILLLNSAGEVVGHSVLSAPSNALEGGGEKIFKLRIRPLPPHVSRLTVSFALPN